MLAALPLTIAPLIVYLLVAFGGFGPTAGDPWTQPVFTLQMLSGARFTLLSGDVLIVAALLLLFVEVLKATRRAAVAIADHLVSTLVAIVHLVLFLVVGVCATSVFFVLTVIAFVDMVGGFTVTIRTASRDLSVDPRAD